MPNEFYTMLYLMFCQIRGLKTNENLLKDTSPEMLFKVCEFHGVTPIVYDAIKDFEHFKDTIKRFKEVKEKSVRKNMMMDIERKRLFSFMDEKGIWHLPLKGVILKDYYPQAGERQMADNDILYDETFRKEVRDWFAQNGYTVVQFGKENHDVYEKEPIYNFEMHHRLFSHIHRSVWAKYYANIQNRLLQMQGCEYAFSTEDFYIYFLCHAFKHFDNSGTGIKFLADLFLYLDKNSNSMDWNYVNTELPKLGLDDFEKQAKKLIGSISTAVDKMQNDSASLETFKTAISNDTMLLHLFRSGKYGTMQNRVEKKLNAYLSGSSKKKKLQYTLERLFPDQTFMRKYYSIFGKYKVLMPIGWIYRIIRGLIIHHKQIIFEANVLHKHK